jgi:hypothetical protein
VLALPETLRQRSSGMVDNLELGTPLGRGSYGKVYKGAPSCEVLPPIAIKQLLTSDSGLDMLAANAACGTPD